MVQATPELSGSFWLILVFLVAQTQDSQFILMNIQEQSEVKYREKRILVAKERMQILNTFLKTAFKIDS